MEIDDETYICNGCGHPLEEGKAFELAGQRWHLPCFRCSTCGNVLDADANLLLLGDGNLICHSCTYSCSACGQKIEDLAILTGDQAFCSGCFRCRNCKKKIENLRYARTSQGIFCMGCHETLMARRRKKTRAPPKPGSAQTREKALPSLPPGAAPSSAFSPDLAELETPSSSYAVTPSATSPPQRQDSRRGLASDSANRGASPYSDDGRQDGPTLPASTYGESRPSNVSRESEDGPDHGFLPMAFDPSPVAPPIARKPVQQPHDPSPSQLSDGKHRDYFGALSSGSGYRDLLREDYRPGSSRSASTERDSARAAGQPRVSPHILYQDKSRYNKENEPPNAKPATQSPYTAPTPAGDESARPKELDSRAIPQNDGFKLQEAPKSKKTSLRSSREAKPPASLSESSPKNEQVEAIASETPSSTGSPSSSINPFDDPKRREAGWTSIAARPTRSDSLAGAARKARSPTTDLQTPTAAAVQQQPSKIERHASVSSVPSSFADAQESLSRDNSVSKTVESPPIQSSPQAPPPRATARLNKTAPNEESAAFRMVPIPPPPASAPIERHKKNESSSTIPSVEAKLEDAMPSSALSSAHLPKHSMDAPFSMEEEMARIMKGDRNSQRHAAEASGASMLRKMSNAVKHGRSFSDRAIGTTSKSPANGSIDISSPMTISSPLLASPTGHDSNDQLAAQLKRAQQRITELESEVHRFGEKMNTSTEIKAANNELREKRTTIVVLDTQRELVVRELEAMTEHLTKAKDSSQPLDLNALKSDILRDFADSLQKLKDSLSAQIEDLMHKRNELQEEIATLIKMKDKGFQEYEELSNKNAQLQGMNNQILHNIQDMYKSNRGVNGPASAAPTANGLGIYHPSARVETPGYSEVRNLNLVNTDSSLPNLLQESEAESATLLTAPKVVNIRKEGQAKKFNWRKGGEKMAKNVTKGIKGAFGEKGMPLKDVNDNPYGIGMPYNQMQAGVAPGSDGGSLSSRGALDPNRSGSGFGFFTGQKPGGIKSMKDNSSTNLAADGSVLFGSELTDRCEFEKRVIPSVVSRCVEEVESRGMNVEGIYRKSGGTGQVKIIQQGFEKDSNYDISDEDLDIHAVTSTLKQYFRKLPTPLITYDVYDNLLEAGRILDKEKQAVSLRMIVTELPEHHRDCLEFLVQHLARVMAHESDNLMTPLNLSVVFAPTIMRPLTIEREMSDMTAQRIALQALLEHCSTVFPDE